MFLSSLSIRRPVFITMVVVALVVVGLIGYFRLGLDLFPTLKIPYVTVTVTYPGAGPREVETKVTKIVEDAVSTVSDVKQIRSFSSEGTSNTVIEFQMEADPDVAAQDIRDRISRARPQLPEDINEPVVSKVDITAMPIMDVAVSGEMPLRELRTLAEDVIKPRLERVAGVASATVTGGLEREVQVAVDADRLRAYGIGVQQVVAAMAAENLNVPAGHIDEIGRRVTVRVPGEFENVAQIRQVLLSTPAGPIHLSDVAQVLDTHKERENITRLDGRESVALSVQKLPEANVVRAADGVRSAVDELNRTLGGRAHLVVATDTSTFARDSVSDVTNNLILGGLLAIIVVFLFLRSLRSTLISAIALPTSIISAFGLMYFAGFTLNMISMMALALAIGMLIDDAIVVIENIYRHAEEGEPPQEAANNGTGEIALAVMAITFTIVAVFVPIAFMSGLAGRMFREFGLTVTFAVLVSLFVSLTLTPMLSSRLLRPHVRGQNNNGRKSLLDRPGDWYDRIDAAYRPMLAWALRHRKVVVLAGVAILVVSLGLVRLLGTALIPQVDRGEINLTLEMPAGTALADTDRVAGRMETLLLGRPEVERVLSTVGSIGSMGILGGAASGADTALIKVKLVPKNKRQKSSWQFMEELREEIARMPDLTASVQQAGLISGATQSPVEIQFRGPDVDQLVTIASQATQRLSDIPGLTDLDISLRPGQPEAQVRIDRTKATNLGLSVAQVANTLRTALDGTVASQYREGGDEYDIRVKLAQADRERVAQLDGIRVSAPDGTPIALREVAHLAMAEGPTQITRTDKVRTVSVTGNILQGYALGTIIQESQKRIGQMNLPAGYSVDYAGEAQRMREVFGSIVFALLLAVIFVYMILAAQFESFVHPFTIGLSLPFALIGAVLALLLTHHTLNMMSMIGIVMLMGLVTKNAILLVDYTNTLRARGLERNEAVLQAGPTRLRPILMTTAAMVFGMLPVALGLGSGSELRAPMAVCVIGGLLSSMFLTLLMVPVVYTLLDDLQRRFRRRSGQEAKA
jgi:HAE1 family hydrophobic/amphiphilic exporter-1